MNELKLFKNERFGEVRTTTINHEPYFMLADVCRVLEIKNSRDALTRLNKKGVAITDTLTNGGNQQATFINESNLYKLTFTSRKPEAEAFTEWVTSEVLPAIRKYGSYSLPNFSNPAEAARAWAKEFEEKQALTKQVKTMKPKADYFDDLVDRKTLTNFRDTAKEFHIEQKKFIDWLLNMKMLYRDKKQQLKPYAEYKEYFHLKEWKTDYKSGVQTLITPHGREAIRMLLEVKPISC